MRRLLLLVLLVGCAPGTRDEHDHDEHDLEVGGVGGDHEVHEGHDDPSPGVVRLDPDAARAAGVRTEPVARRILLPELQTTGRVAFDENRIAHVGPRSDGRVAAVRADLGSKLAAGEVVALLDSVEVGRARADYLAARAALGAAEAALAREEALLADRISSEADALAARAAFATARARASAAAETLRVLGLSRAEIEGMEFGAETPGRLALRSPFAGTLVERHLQQGEFVGPADTLFTVADLGSLWIWIDVYERDLARVHEGDQARVTVEAWPGREWTGTVTYLRDSVDPDTRTVRARIEVSNPDGALRPEMFATVRLLDPHHADADAPRVLAVPEGAVQRTAAGEVVYVAGGPGVWAQRAVAVGHRSGGYVEIRDGLEEGEEVVVAGSFLLKTEASRGSLGGGHTH